MPAAGPLEQFRDAEAGLLRQWFTPGARVLDIGAGTGYQAQVFDSWGCRVTAIDVQVCAGANQFWPVHPFNGTTLPFEDGSFDIVFTSNVLEHVRERERLLREIARVLVPHGRAIHVVPSSTWRLWTSVARYGHAVAQTFRGSSKSQRQHASEVVLSEGGTPHNGKTLGTRVFSRLLGPPHGEYPSTLSELFHYRRSAWKRVLGARGWTPTLSRGTGLFYTGYTMAPTLPIATRRMLARFLGSSCHVFVVERGSPALPLSRSHDV